jgi:FdhD protein
VDAAPLALKGVRSWPVIRFTAGHQTPAQLDHIIEEVPVAIAYNGIAYTVMMCTPTDLEEFVIGFSLSEGIITHHYDVHDIDFSRNCDGITLNVTIANRCLSGLQKKRRSVMGTTACGLCGEASLETVHRDLEPLPDTVRFDIRHIPAALVQLQAQQVINQLTGASHAAAYLDVEGQLVVVFEDVGRHIALDKLVGYIHRHGLHGGVILVTSRASFEMVQKAAVAGVEVLLAISSVTQKAVQLAASVNMTLLGYCRPQRCNVYTVADRIIGSI